MKILLAVVTSMLLAACVHSHNRNVTNTSIEKGNVIFIHPDGTGVGHWNLLRLITQGPDGMTNWDQMSHLGIYRPHQTNSLITSSNAGATVHAYGKKVKYHSYGLDGVEPLTALSGKSASLMQEAMAAGIRVGIVNTGHIGEPGTGVYLASVEQRSNRESIAEQVLASGADVIFTGGEMYTLPKGTIGFHGVEGTREDGRNLLMEAKQAGYQIIYTLDELLNLPSNTGKIIGIFAAKDTFNAKSEEELKQLALPRYNPGQPSFDDMVTVALRVLSSNKEQRFFLVAEEEATDNFSNAANAAGVIDALIRSDAAIGSSLDFLAARETQDTLLIVAADSDAGSPTIWSPKDGIGADPLPLMTETGAQLDGIDGPASIPFLTAPDALGNRFNFGIAWPMTEDGYGSSVTKTHGYRSDDLQVVVDNTDIYRISYRVLFGTEVEKK